MTLWSRVQLEATSHGGPHLHSCQSGQIDGVCAGRYRVTTRTVDGVKSIERTTKDESSDTTELYEQKS